jgi:hypothetical protein
MNEINEVEITISEDARLAFAQFGDAVREFSKALEGFKIAVSRYAFDGFGNTWPPCAKCGSQMQVMRPGEARCPKCDE